MGTNVYIDGFNLYYGALRNTQFKWLDLAALCTKLLPNRNIKRIRYFTARVNPLPHDPGARTRQDVYLRAISTIPNLTIHRGRFADRTPLLPQFPLAYRNPRNPTSPPQRVQVLRTEEKGSDVNLATLLLVDCFDGDFDEAVVISNDGDLALPIQMVTKKYGKTVGVVNPHPKAKISGDLIRFASYHLRTINKKVLATCQFSATLTDAQGAFTKPATW